MAVDVRAAEGLGVKRDPEKAKAWRRRSKPLARSGVLGDGSRPRKRLSSRSARQRAVYVERRKLVAQLLASRPACEARWDDRCWGRTTEIHEPLTRARGGSILDPGNCLAVCGHCHREIHDHPAESTRRGLLRSRAG